MSSESKLKLGFVSDGRLLAKFAFVKVQSGQVVVVGRSKDAQVSVNNNVVSGEHAQLLFDANGDLHVIDLNSTNGTFLNDRKLEPGVPYQIRTNDVLKLAGDKGVKLVFNPDDYEPVSIQVTIIFLRPISLKSLIRSV